MTAFTKPDGGFIVVYSHDGEQPDERRARGAGEAAAVAIRMLAARLKIYPGEVIQGRRADEPQADDTQADLPEVSRASRLAARPAVRSGGAAPSWGFGKQHDNDPSTNLCWARFGRGWRRSAGSKVAKRDSRDASSCAPCGLRPDMIR
jgi:hypothetical protein